jgi:hypothetical protein
MGKGVEGCERETTSCSLRLKSVCVGWGDSHHGAHARLCCACDALFFVAVQSYEPRYYYMEVVLLVYKLIMSAVVVLFLPDTLAQV